MFLTPFHHKDSWGSWGKVSDSWSRGRNTEVKPEVAYRTRELGGSWKLKQWECSLVVENPNGQSLEDLSNKITWRSNATYQKQPFVSMRPAWTTRQTLSQKKTIHDSEMVTHKCSLYQDWWAELDPVWWRETGGSGKLSSNPCPTLNKQMFQKQGKKLKRK